MNKILFKKKRKSLYSDKELREVIKEVKEFEKMLKLQAFCNSLHNFKMK